MAGAPTRYKEHLSLRQKITGETIKNDCIQSSYRADAQTGGYPATCDTLSSVRRMQIHTQTHISRYSFHMVVNKNGHKRQRERAVSLIKPSASVNDALNTGLHHNREAPVYV